ncbi:MAG: hypothetical protein LBP89_01670 [Helicobacteraceae bacterium]|jgi:hypothetical protein|nr:hypothetical protein [Helicobacteraceae bacterium]
MNQTQRVERLDESRQIPIETIEAKLNKGYKMSANQNQNESIDLSTQSIIEVSPEAAIDAGAFIEDAISADDAIEAVIGANYER